MYIVSYDDLSELKEYEIWYQIDSYDGLSWKDIEAWTEEGLAELLSY